MKRQLFEYKIDFVTRRVVFKPYCFRWVLAYRLKEFYLWLFFKIAKPFVWLAQDLGHIKEGEDFMCNWSDYMKLPFKPLKLEKK